MSDIVHIVTAVISATAISLVLSAAGSVIAFRQQGGGRIRDYFRYLFPPDLVRRRSCYQDAGFVLLKQLMRPWTTGLFVLFTSAKMASLTYELLVSSFGARPQDPMPTALFVVLLTAGVLIQDFLRFGSHHLLHDFEVLWDTHKVHHSADFLTPLTNHRVHIVEEFIQQAVTGVSVGPVLGVSAYLTSTAISTNELMGFDAYVLLDSLCFAMLRHSHIGLSFGWLERYLLSPKQHQMHHSIDPRHWNKNFGFMLACWDRMACTIYYSNPREKLQFGILDDEFVDYNTVLKLHFMPYLKYYKWWSRRADSVRSMAPVPQPDLATQSAPKI